MYVFVCQYTLLLSFFFFGWSCDRTSHSLLLLLLLSIPPPLASLPRPSATSLAPVRALLERRNSDEVDSAQRPPGRREALAEERSHSTWVPGPAVIMPTENPPATSMPLCETFRPTVVTKSSSSTEDRSLQERKTANAKYLGAGTRNRPYVIERNSRAASSLTATRIA